MQIYLDMYTHMMTWSQSDLILVDPRGVGWSNFLLCGFNESTYFDVLQTQQNEWQTLAELSATTSNATLTKKVDWLKGHPGSACGTGDLEYLAHINAPTLARDLDLIRSLSGYDTLNYYGLEYGSVLGTVYAGMFPKHVGKMILDGTNSVSIA